MKSNDEKKRNEYAQLIFAPKDSDNNIVVFGAATLSVCFAFQNYTNFIHILLVLLSGSFEVPRCVECRCYSVGATERILFTWIFLNMQKLSKWISTRSAVRHDLKHFKSTSYPVNFSFGKKKFFSPVQRIERRCNA